MEHITYDGGCWMSLNEKMGEAFPHDKIQRTPVDSPPVGWHDRLFMVLLTHMKATLKWLRDTDTQTKPAIFVLCYLNRVLVPFRACCEG
eukprot:12623644-Prorocentrum_lima.AAC.1